MLTRLELTNFKNFKSAALPLGPFNLLIGANASGKSNLREAFRFLHALGHGYTLPEIFGGKWGDGGIQQWSGLRSGKRDVAFYGKKSFSIKIQSLECFYEIVIEPGMNGDMPLVIEEKIKKLNDSQHIFKTKKRDKDRMTINFPKFTKKSFDLFGSYQFIPTLTLSHLPGEFIGNFPGKEFFICENLRVDFANMRFFDFAPEFLRKPSIPGQFVLGDRGENLSSVLQYIFTDSVKKRILLYWLHSLTPMDILDIEFEHDSAGKICLVLVEKNGMRVTANSASDGTLRFLAMLAVFLSPNPPRLCFIEELETGIHPTRQYLLVDFLERIADEGKTQIIATTHSPQILTFLSPKNHPFTSLLYRHENRSSASIIPLLDLPDAARVFKNNTLGQLHASAWFENTASCTNPGKSS